MSELVYKVISCAHELLLLTQQYGAFHINSHILPKLVLMLHFPHLQNADNGGVCPLWVLLGWIEVVHAM